MICLALVATLAAHPLDVPLGAMDTGLQVGMKLTPAEELLKKAQELRYTQRWYEAAAVYRKFLSEFPESSRLPQARFYLAATLERDQRWDEAADAYTRFLADHPDQRSLSKESKLGRIRCWGIRQGASDQAVPGLRAALSDPDRDVRVQAALELARTMDRRALPALKEGVGTSTFGDRCSMALISFGERANTVTSGQSESRFFVLRIQQKGKDQEIVIRLSAVLVRALGNYLSDEHLRQVRAKGVDVENLGDQLQKLPKGTVLFSVTDKSSQVTVTVD